jgi:rhodanese-related sulfurtransferase
MLTKLGIKRVEHLVGGIDAWEKAGGKLRRCEE